MDIVALPSSRRPSSARSTSSNVHNTNGMLSARLSRAPNSMAPSSISRYTERANTLMKKIEAASEMMATTTTTNNAGDGGSGGGDTDDAFVTSMFTNDRSVPMGRALKHHHARHQQTQLQQQQQPDVKKLRDDLTVGIDKLEMMIQSGKQRLGALSATGVETINNNNNTANTTNTDQLDVTNNTNKNLFRPPSGIRRRHHHHTSGGGAPLHSSDSSLTSSGQHRQRPASASAFALFHDVHTNEEVRTELQNRVHSYNKKVLDKQEQRRRQGRDVVLNHLARVKNGYFNADNIPNVRERHRLELETRLQLAHDRHAMQYREKQQRRYELAYAPEARLHSQEHDDEESTESLLRDTWMILSILAARALRWGSAVEKDRQQYPEKRLVSKSLALLTPQQRFIKSRIKPMLHVVRQRRAQQLLHFFRVRAPMIMFAMRLRLRQNAVAAIKWALRRRNDDVYIVFVHAMRSFFRKVTMIQKSLRLSLRRKRIFYWTLLNDVLELEEYTLNEPSSMMNRSMVAGRRTSKPEQNMGDASTIELEGGRVPLIVVYHIVDQFYKTQMHKLKFDVRQWVKDMKKYQVLRRTKMADVMTGTRRKSVARSGSPQNNNKKNNNNNNELKEPARPLLRIHFEEVTLRSLLQDARIETNRRFSEHRKNVQKSAQTTGKVSEEMVAFKSELYRQPLPDSILAMGKMISM
eukprot:PhM_4_TR202/c0_g1_i1/m.95669